MPNIFIVGIGFVGLWFIMCLRYAIRRKTDSHWYDGLLAFIIVIMLTITLTQEANTDATFDMIEMITIGAGIALFLPAMRVLLLAEKPLASVGALASVTGLILMIASFAIPMLAPTITTETTIAIPGSNVTDQDFEIQLVSNNEFDASTSNIRPISLPEVDDSVPNAIPTLAIPTVIFATPTPRPELATTCEATVTTRLNLRAAPSTSAGAVIGVVEEDTVVTLVGMDTTNDWWYMIGDESEGWLFGDFLDLEDICDDLPVRFWDETGN